ncbi:NUDIX domain-containing protein [Streptomyces sp. NPDC057136]|uniref:NUDIX domain-containing protein n=1 Tax=Streptomyces sp. NPDC057136 TaxID=3346029 RepID=UPI003626DA0F
MSTNTAASEGRQADELSGYDRSLPRKRVAAGVLFFDGEDRVMLVDPVYKEPWEIPGGAVEWDESPRDGAVREVKEELGLAWGPGRLLGVDWTGPRPGRSEGMTAVFDGGVLSPEEVAGIRLQTEELRAYEFVGLDGIRERLIPLLARRVEACVDARRCGVTVYLENGVAIG